MPTPDPLTYVPETIEAGNSASFVLTYADYTPAAGWGLTFAITNGIDKSRTVTGSTSGTGFLVTLATTDTATLTAGDYTWAAYATASGQRRTADTGRISILANLGVPAVKTWWQEQVENLQTVLAGFNATDRMTVEIGTGIKYTRANVADYRKQLTHAMAMVRREQDAAAAKRGEASSRIIGIEFAPLS